MSRIISVSRRTDIPAFYGPWFMNRLKYGFAGHANPFGGQKYVVSLKPEDDIVFTAERIFLYFIFRSTLKILFGFSKPELDILTKVTPSID